VADTLSFDLKLQKPGFELAGAADIPLQGICGIVGASGSGKTTLLRALAGLEPDAIGRVRFRDTDWTGLAPQHRSIGFVFQDARLFPHLNVIDNVRYGARRRGTDETRIQEVISAFDLVGLLGRRPGTLSGGEMRRVAMARSLAAKPGILFLDEPMAGLDTDRKAEVLPYITRAVDQFSLAVLYVTHSQFEIQVLADHLLPVANGRIGSLKPGPACFTLPVAKAADGLIQFRLGETVFDYAAAGQVGERWELRPGPGALLVENHPGDATAAAVIPASAVADLDEAGGACLMVDDQKIGFPVAPGLAAGRQLWLICPGLVARCRTRKT